MGKIKIGFLVLLVLGFTVSGASAVTFTMFESDFNQDGVITSSFSGNFVSIQYIQTFSTVGPHYGAVFVDPEIDEAINTFFNEYGSVVGIPVAGQSWEIDEPGYSFGDIFTNFTNGALDNTNSITLALFPNGEDVSMALGWNFSLGAGETAALNYYITAVQPTSGFYLVQTDPDSQASLYFYSTLQKGGVTVPEPGILLLLGLGLGFVGLGRKTLFRK